MQYVDLVLELLESALAEHAFWNWFAREPATRPGTSTIGASIPSLTPDSCHNNFKDDLARAQESTLATRQP